MSFALISCLTGYFFLILNLVSKRFYICLTEMTRKFRFCNWNLEYKPDNLFSYCRLILTTDGGLCLSNGTETKHISIPFKLKDICLGVTHTENEENYELLIVDQKNFAYVVSSTQFEILRSVKATFLSNTLIQEAKFQSCVSGLAHLVLVDVSVI